MLGHGAIGQFAIGEVGQVPPPTPPLVIGSGGEIGIIEEKQISASVSIHIA